MGLKDKNNKTSITGEVNFGHGFWATANLRWSIKGVLQQRFDGMNGEQVWLDVAVEELQEGTEKG